MPEIANLERQEFAETIDAPHGALEKLDRYGVLLAEWNRKFNLISETTLPHIWRRHFLDSAQLLKLIPANHPTLADLGAGAGFPGLVLCILGIAKVHLIESIGKKAGFLRAVIEDLRLDATVHQARIEDIQEIKFDVITARALKPLPQLLKLSKPLMKKESLCFFLKGQKLDSELTEAAKYWKFDSETFPSLSDHSGTVLKIYNLKAGSDNNAARRHRS